MKGKHWTLYANDFWRVDVQHCRIITFVRINRNYIVPVSWKYYIFILCPYNYINVFFYILIFREELIKNIKRIILIANAAAASICKPVSSQCPTSLLSKRLAYIVLPIHDHQTGRNRTTKPKNPDKVTSSWRLCASWETATTNTKS